MRSMLAGRFFWFAWMVAFPVAAGADAGVGDAILAQNAQMTLTRADYDAALVRLVPEDRRPDFASSPKLINGLLNMLLLRKTLAAEARAAGLDREPIPEGADADATLADRFLARLDTEANADFDRRIEGFTAKAREDYLVNRKDHFTTEQFDFSQIFVDTTKRGDEAALRIADKARAELLTGADFATLARDVSDDRASAANGGRVNGLARAGLDPTLASALYAMKNVGEISDVVHARNGYYVIRLDGRRPARQQTFDEAKDGLLAKLRRAHVEAWRLAKTDAIAKDPGLRVNQPAVDALLTTTDPEALRRALQSLRPNPSPN